MAATFAAVDQENPMLPIDNVALFIGVDDDSAFDASMGNPPNTSHLFGSRNDAHVFWRVCRELGIPPENLRILMSPALDPAHLDAPAACGGEATEAAILAGVAWLSERLGGEERPPGLLTYSGHGDFIEGKGLVICPSDVTGPSLTHAIPFSVIARLLEARGAMAHFTVVLDCCHAGAGEARPGRRASSLTGRPLPPALAAPGPLLGGRELAACGRAAARARRARRPTRGSVELSSIRT